MLDFVGRFERLADDYQIISERLGLQIQLPHLNRTEPTSLADYYDAESIKRLQRTFQIDLETFGYASHPDSCPILSAA